MQELTLDVGEKILIGGEIVLHILPKTHPKAIPAQTVRIGIEASIDVIVS